MVFNCVQDIEELCSQHKEIQACSLISYKYKETSCLVSHWHNARAFWFLATGEDEERSSVLCFVTSEDFLLREELSSSLWKEQPIFPEGEELSGVFFG